MTLLGSAPPLTSTSRFCKGAVTSRPGCIRRGAPVKYCARPEAKRTLRSLSVRGYVQPTSPMTPDLTPVPSTPLTTSSTI